jgi:uncharacterized RDD family membrane protein YckC
MKCPKCQYITFDSGVRCRNCGYEFSLSPDVAQPAGPADLPIQDGTEPLGPFSDLSLNDVANLPLFTRPGADPDAPLIAPRPTPRPPLSVRRPPAVPPRPRPRRDDTPAEPLLALDTADLAPPVTFGAPEEVREHHAHPVEESSHGADASIPARLAGGAIDLLLVAAIDVTVIYFTLRTCELTFAQVALLPIAPLAAFLALLNGGYLATFVAAGGQTIGKMAVGTRVVPADPAAPPHERVSFGHAIVRAAAYLVSAVPLGLGFLPAAGRERRALHDRLADTRVVKA